MLRLFGIIERMYRFARGFFDYFAGINIDNPSKRNINTLLYSIKPKSAQIHALDPVHYMAFPGPLTRYSRALIHDNARRRTFFFGPKFFLTKNLFWSKKHFGPKKAFGPKK